MLSLKKYKTEIIDININEHHIIGNYEYWYKYHKKQTKTGRRIEIVENKLGKTFTRKDIHKLYKDKKLDIVTKFLAAMIWGHESEKDGKRDARGPWKVAKMFENFKDTKDILESSHSSFNEDILSESYRLLDLIPQCGQSFLTKHLYFLGKASNSKSYPVILDERVAAGLLNLSMKNGYYLNIFKTQVHRNFPAYWHYLKLTKHWADEFGCEPEQIEYFLFQNQLTLPKTK